MSPQMLGSPSRRFSGGSVSRFRLLNHRVPDETSKKADLRQPPPSPSRSFLVFLRFTVLGFDPLEFSSTGNVLSSFRWRSEGLSLEWV